VSEQDQEPTIAALSDPRFFPERPPAVEHVQTHISHVFLAGSRVYKLKKAVRLSFLDFATRDARRVFCDEEVRLNRRLAPAVYLGVQRVTRGADGQLELDGSGEVVDDLVCMRRLPAARTLAALIEAGTVESAMLDELAELIARFHAAAPPCSIAAPLDALAATWRQTLELAAPLVGDALAPELHAVLRDHGRGFIGRHASLLRDRAAAGRVREGHGDLHAEHVYFIEAPVPATDLPALAPGIYVVDCVEFSLALRCNDVASEIAFTAMDLRMRGREDLARDFVRRYATITRDDGIERLLPFYACYRACVRGAVEGIKSREAEVPPADRASALSRSRRYFDLALRYAWESEGPALIACAGLSGSGKSTVAEAVAAATGFELVSSDRLRKETPSSAGPGPYDSGSYTPEARDAIYGLLTARAAQALARGRGVVADATFLRRAQRDRLAVAAASHHARHVFVECRAPEAAARERLTRRRDSLSDARWETYVDQRGEYEAFGPDEPHVLLDTGRPFEPWTALRALWSWYRDVPGSHPLRQLG
jgi:aminoglycoside phosphotransferase family enzyme/predicted kinase